MLEIENETYTMNENSDLAVKIKRVGGTTGEITAKLEPNPGSAIQKHFDTQLISTVRFAEGESAKSNQSCSTCKPCADNGRGCIFYTGAFKQQPGNRTCKLSQSNNS